jgi:hypothetical protein
MYVAARGAPFTRAHLYTNVLFFFYVIIFLFVLFVVRDIDAGSISTSHAYYHRLWYY